MSTINSILLVVNALMIVANLGALTLLAHLVHQMHIGSKQVEQAIKEGRANLK